MDMGTFRTFHPQVGDCLTEALARCVEQCTDRILTCIPRADACLDEDLVAELRQCIRVDLD